MEGEIVASGSAHIDNIAPCLFGGLTLTVGIDNPRVKQIPVPSSVRCVLVHPHMYLGTREARAILKADITRSDFVWQSANLAGFISGCYSNDLDMIRDSFNDVIIEPQRQSLIPGLQGRAARRHGGRGARLLDLRRRPDGFCVGRDSVCRGGARRHGGRIRRARPCRRIIGSRAWRITARAWSRPDVGPDEIREFARRRAAGRAERRHCSRAGAGRRPVCAHVLAGASIRARSRESATCREIARVSAAGFFAGDRSGARTRAISREPRSIFPRRPPPSRARPDPLFALELYHGPTAAFKDFGARFLAESLQRLEAAATAAPDHPGRHLRGHGRGRGRGVPSAPLGARGDPLSHRSGESAAGTAADCWGDNVASLRVDGTFDDCQRLVKEAFQRSGLSRRHRFSSANSINIGRLLPQMRVLRRRPASRCTPHRAQGLLHHSGGQSGQCLRRRVGPGARVSRSRASSWRTT